MSNVLDGFISAYKADSEFDFDNKVILHWYPERIIAKTSKNSNVLELGIGHGYSCSLFENYYADYTVIEGSEDMISKYKNDKNSTKAKIIHSYFENFEKKEKYDVVIMGFILEHVDNPDLILKKFKELISENGKCYIAVPNAECLHRRFGAKAGLLDDVMQLSEGDLAFGHKRLYSVQSLEELLESCGYKVLKKEGIFLKPMTTSQLVSLNLSPSILRGMCEVGIEYPELCAGLLFEACVNQ